MAFKILCQYNFELFTNCHVVLRYCVKMFGICSAKCGLLQCSSTLLVLRVPSERFGATDSSEHFWCLGPIWTFQVPWANPGPFWCRGPPLSILVSRTHLNMSGAMGSLWTFLVPAHLLWAFLVPRFPSEHLRCLGPIRTFQVPWAHPGPFWCRGPPLNILVSRTHLNISGAMGSLWTFLVPAHLLWAFLVPRFPPEHLRCRGPIWTQAGLKLFVRKYAIKRKTKKICVAFWTKQDDGKLAGSEVQDWSIFHEFYSEFAVGRTIGKLGAGVQGTSCLATVLKSWNDLSSLSLNFEHRTHGVIGHLTFHGCSGVRLQNTTRAILPIVFADDLIQGVHKPHSVP
jgi:hypothetical protein